VDHLLIAGLTERTRRPALRIGELETDARLLFYRSSAGQSVSQLAFVDGSFVRTVGGGGLRVEAPRVLPQYFADLESVSPGPRAGSLEGTE
jgi:hypothetical protein